MRIVIYRKYNDYIIFDGSKDKVMELKQMLDNEGFRWYIISGRTE